jgi:threonine dehydrogenase-like Zn-dependent dehydrogenase
MQPTCAYRWPTSDPSRCPTSLSDEQALFLSDIFPTGYMAAENAQIKDGETVAMWRCGPVGQFAIRSALMLGAGRVIAIDEIPERLAMAESRRSREDRFLQDRRLRRIDGPHR